MQIDKLQWETDARVYLPKGHHAIIYDEIVADIFGVKNSILIAVANEKKGVYNAETLNRIARITEQVANLPGVSANRVIDVMSIATASAFVGDDDTLGSERIMRDVPSTKEGFDQLRNTIQRNADLFVGNIISEDGKIAIIRAKLKEGIANRYSTYWAIKTMLDSERGLDSDWGGGWSDSSEWNGGEWDDSKPVVPSTEKGEWPNGMKPDNLEKIVTADENGDMLYMAGRPVIEVSSGLSALKDIQMMIPLLFIVLGVMLFFFYRTWRGVLIPMLVISCAVIWTMGTMAFLNVPMYTISTMLPVILVAVGIGDSMHVMSRYYDHVLKNPYGQSSEIVTGVMVQLAPPLITTTITTIIGFLALLFSEMPPFKIFGLFTVLGIAYCWLLSVVLVPAILTMMKPKVGDYLKKKRSLRVHDEDSGVARLLTTWGQYSTKNSKIILTVTLLFLIVSAFGASKMYVNSSWMSDFSKESDVSIANDLINDRMDGAIFLNVVVEGKSPGALKSPELLRKIEGMQQQVEKHLLVGDSISIVDYLKSVNKNLHSGDIAYDRLPDTEAEINEFLFLLSMSGRPDELDEVIDYDYRQANVSFLIKTDETQYLKEIIAEVNDYVDREMSGFDVKVNLAGSANNSYIWAELLIDSQVMAVLLSKVGILIMAIILFRSVILGLLTVLPVTVTTLVIAGGIGFMGIPLDVSTALAAGVAIGVGVDYAVHYLFKYRLERKNLLKHDDAIVESMRSVGKTVVFNAAVVTAGFMVLLASQFPPHVKLGAFVSSYMVVSCIAALVLLPLFLTLINSGRQSKAV
ncbi:MAG: MMPL family transporter [Gammaproteobacteria bacterium]|nr:MMPL family transporter [Gammaproteobacteria bacterium]